MAEPKPTEIARREFEVVRRGFDQQEVRGFLHEISALVERLQRAESELGERAARAEKRLAAAEHPDESAMLELLGEETTRVLTSAREAAADIRLKAEQAAERIIAEASAQAAQTRSGAIAEADKRLAEIRAEGEKILASARGELDRRTTEAEEAAERIRAEATAQVQALRDEAQRVLAEAKEQATTIVDAAKAEGKQMVTDAQSVRERVLRDLSAKRKKARQQIEQLNAGRDRLLQAYEVVRTTVDQATTELSSSMTDARLLAAAAARRVEAEPQPTLEQLDQELATGRLGDLPITVSGRPAPALQPVPDEEPPPAPEPQPLVKVPKGRKSRSRDAASAALAPDAPEAPAPPEPAAPAPGPPPEAEVEAEPAVPDVSDFEPVPGTGPAPETQAALAAQRVALATEPAPSRAPAPLARERAPEPPAGLPPGPVAAGAAPDDAAPAPAPGPSTEPVDDQGAASPADAVFAKLHADADVQVGEPADREPAGRQEEAPPSADAPAFEDRDRVIEPVERDLAKSLKRTLADEQNEVLDRLRTAKPAGVDDLLPSADAHAERWAAVSEKALREAATAGATWAGGGGVDAGDLADELARSVVLPLRERIDRSFVASDGNLDDVADRVKALYREWKNQKLPEAVPHFVAAAYARGVYEALPAGGQVRWVVDPANGPCPDCDDNVLAGAVRKGDDFPTGGQGAPAHPGCRCLVLPAPT